MPKCAFGEEMRRHNGSIGHRNRKSILSFAAALQLWHVRVVLAHVHAKVTALFGFVRTVWALMGGLFVAALIVFMPSQCGLPAILFATVTAGKQLFAAVTFARFDIRTGHEYRSHFINGTVARDDRSIALTQRR